MKEQEWLACNSCDRALSFLRKRVSNRKLRLFACACCRLLGDLLTGEAAYSALAVVEEYAEGRTSRDALRAARQAAKAAIKVSDMAGHVARIAVVRAAHEVAWQAARQAASVTTEAVSYRKPQRAASIDAAVTSVYQAELALLRDIFNPFRPVSVTHSWRSTDVLTLARAAYEHRTLPAGTLEPERLALLADALEEASCDSADLLAHLRGEGLHVRGCWAVDVCLGKS